MYTRPWAFETPVRISAHRGEEGIFLILPTAFISAPERTGSAACFSESYSSFGSSPDIFLKSRDNSRRPRTTTAPSATYGSRKFCGGKAVPQKKAELEDGANSYVTSSTSFSDACMGNENMLAVPP